ncbi:MAG: RHS repeat protein, partial [Chloroflexales bacterium]|nr:RHS repeat protein [Chloroflexales bacterium]
VDWTARNLTGYTGGTSLPAQPPAFDPAAPDANVTTFYGYDGLGRTTLVTQTGILTGTFDPGLRRFSAATERVTRTEYDDLNRPITVTLNYQPGVPAGPDVNVQTLTQYDLAGNVTGQRDGLGRWTVTDYDALNRPITVTLNYENGDPLSVDAANQDWATITDTDSIQVTRYTADGQVAEVIANYVDGVFDPADPVHDRRTTYQYDDLGRLERTVTTEEDGDPATGGTDTDRVSATAYDSAGRLQGRQDPLARWVSQQYDALSRVSATIQNCRDAAGNPVASGCAAQTDQRNVRQQTRYDGLGRVIETEDALGTVTRMTYDGVGRTVTTTRNYVAGGPRDSATNVTTETAYNGLGWTTVVTDALGAATHSEHDALGRTVVI